MPTITLLSLERMFVGLDRMFDPLMPISYAKQLQINAVIEEIMRYIAERREFNRGTEERIQKYKAEAMAGLKGWGAWWHRHLFLLKLVAAAAMVILFLSVVAVVHYGETWQGWAALWLGAAIGAILLPIMFIMQSEYRKKLKSPDKILIQKCSCSAPAVTASGLCEACFLKDLEIQQKIRVQTAEAIRLTKGEEWLDRQAVVYVESYPERIPDSLTIEVEAAVARLLLERTAVVFEPLTEIKREIGWRYKNRHGHDPDWKIVSIDQADVRIPLDGLRAFLGAKGAVDALPTLGLAEFRLHVLDNDDPLLTVRFKIWPFKPEAVIYQWD